MAFVGISLKNNREQQELARLMNENHRPIIICTGNAGTGKTFTALAAALQLKQEKKYKTEVLMEALYENILITSIFSEKQDVKSLYSFHSNIPY